MLVEDFVERTTKLLCVEREAEISEKWNLNNHLSVKQLEQRGLCLNRLTCVDRSHGLYGRVLASFRPSWSGREIRPNNFSSGDVIGVSMVGSAKDVIVSGVVLQVSSLSIKAAFDDLNGIFSLDDSKQYCIMKMANDVTYRRLKRALQDLRSYTTGPCEAMIAVLFGISPPSPPLQLKECQWVNPLLDDSQREAVRFALAQREVAIVHGPPGTGKTTTLVEIILQAVKDGNKVLALAPSNVAIDNLVERLSTQHQRIVRIGHPARFSTLTRFTLDAMVAASDQMALAADAQRDLNRLLMKIFKNKKSTCRDSRSEIKQLRREVRKRETVAVREVLTNANVVLSTLTSASVHTPLKHLNDGHFDLIIIDECSQALEVACWVGLLNGPRCVLAGDPHQLPPTIVSRQASSDGLGVTLMDRVMKTLGDNVVRMLTTQYRMNRHIMTWSSQTFYSGRLQAHSTVADHLLRDLPGVEDGDVTDIPLLFVDCAGCELQELQLPHNASKGNNGEADVVAAHVRKLVDAGVPPRDIAVVTPYNMQVELLSQRLGGDFEDIEVKTVDGFQGREKEVVVISLVRSNDRREVGFLADKRRINVAVTRARRHLAIVGDSETISSDPTLCSLFKYMEDVGQVWSAHQYIHASLVTPGCFYLPRHCQHSLPSPPGVHRSSPLKPDTELKNKGKGGDRCQTKTRHSSNLKLVQPHLSVAEKQETYRCVLDDFLRDTDRKRMSFRPEFTSYDRMVIHELSDRLDLQHISSGEGLERHLVISKCSPHSAEEGNETRIIPRTDESPADPRTNMLLSNSDAEMLPDSVSETSLLPAVGTSANMSGGGIVSSDGFPPYGSSSVCDSVLDTVTSVCKPSDVSLTNLPAKVECDSVLDTVTSVCKPSDISLTNLPTAKVECSVCDSVLDTVAPVRSPSDVSLSNLPSAKVKCSVCDSVLDTVTSVCKPSDVSLTNLPAKVECDSVLDTVTSVCKPSDISLTNLPSAKVKCSVCDSVLDTVAPVRSPSDVSLSNLPSAKMKCLHKSTNSHRMDNYFQLDQSVVLEGGYFSGMESSENSEEDIGLACGGSLHSDQSMLHQPPAVGDRRPDIGTASDVRQQLPHRDGQSSIGQSRNNAKLVPSLPSVPRLPCPASSSSCITGKKKSLSQVSEAARALDSICDDDFDGLVAAVTDLDRKCGLRHCKTVVSCVQGINCQHCDRRFCFAHLLPEIHGCGNAAKVKARKSSIPSGVVAAVSKVPLAPAKRAVLERKLNKKMERMSEKRHPKNSKK